MTDRLLHNLWARRILEVYVRFVQNMPTGCRNRLTFDNYLSDWFDLDNGIIQGDPLSMLLYLFYNADMLDIVQGRQEVCLGYVDDMALVAAAGTFQGTHRILGKMMAKSWGGYAWSRTHNSRFKMSKSVLVDFSRDKCVERPNMMLQRAIMQHHVSSWASRSTRSYAGISKQTMPWEGPQNGSWLTGGWQELPAVSTCG